MLESFNISFADSLCCLSQALDMLHWEVASHHKRVTYIVTELSSILGYNEKAVQNAVHAALIHDCGALTLGERLDTLQFDMDNTEAHSLLGARLLSQVKRFNSISRIIRYHHVRYDDISVWEDVGIAIPVESQVIHLADRVAVLFGESCRDFSRKNSDWKKIINEKNKMFSADLIDALEKVAEKKSFWQSIKYIQKVDLVCDNRKKEREVYDKLSFSDFEELACLFASVLDFRSSYTFSHSAGVAIIAGKIASSLKFTEKQQRAIKVAGYLHDLGKLAVPNELLEKPSKLTENEFDKIKAHPKNTFKILSSLGSSSSIIKNIGIWASNHHEQPNGKGYPHGITEDELTVECKIIAVADVFAALLERRSYRENLAKTDVLKTMKYMAKYRALDPEIVNIAITDSDEIIAVRNATEKSVKCKYREFRRDFNEKNQFLA